MGFIERRNFKNRPAVFRIMESNPFHDSGKTDKIRVGWLSFEGMVSCCGDYTGFSVGKESLKFSFSLSPCT